MNEADALARRIAEALLQREGTGPAWAITIDDAREGYALVRMVVREDMLNGHRSAHGGMIFALADTAFAYACNSRNENTVAQSATIAFLAPLATPSLPRRAKPRAAAAAAFIKSACAPRKAP